MFSEVELALIYATDPLACLLCETGMRKSEARNLQRRHIDLGPGDLIVYNGKGAKDRVVPLTMRAAQVVADLDITAGPELRSTISGPRSPEAARSSSAVTRSPTRRCRDGGQTRTEGVLARAGVPYRNMHVTRHTFATRLIRRGARIENVKQLMGHTSIQTTVDLYGHLDVEDARADLRLLEVEV